MNGDYLDDRLLALRSETIISEFGEEVPVNRDFHPWMYMEQIGHWLTLNGTSYRVLVIVPVLLFILFGFRIDRVTAGLYTGGFTAASLEVVLLLAYQLYFGSIYLSTALFFAVFMGGLALGSSVRTGGRVEKLLGGRHTAIGRYYRLQYFLLVFAVALPFLVKLPGRMPGLSVFAQFLFFVLVFILALAVGYEFLLAARLRKGSFRGIAGDNYSTDLLGSALGAFLTAIVFLPLIGIMWTCLLVAFLNLISGSMAFSIRKSY